MGYNLIGVQLEKPEPPLRKTFLKQARKINEAEYMNFGPQVHYHPSLPDLVCKSFTTLCTMRNSVNV